MPHLRHYTALITVFTLFACHKSSAPGSNNTPPVTGSMKINMLYSLGAAPESYELIISQPGGSILLDTIAQTTVSVQATLKTNDTLVDVAAIVPGNNNGASYTVQLFRSINASSITTLAAVPYRIRTSVGATIPKSVIYTHVPPITFQGADLSQAILFTSYPYNEGGESYNQYDPSGPSLRVNYQLFGNNYAYLLLSQDGLYSLHRQINSIDTVDCSKMDTALSLTFDRPYPFTIDNESSSFFGLPDSTDLTDIISFTDILVSSARPGVDFEYPNVPVQKYEMTLYGETGTNDGLYYYFYGSQLPHTLPFPVESDFSITSTQPSNFSVSFANTNHTYYYTGWLSASVILDIYAPPSLSSFQPISWLTNQKSKLLASTSYSDLVLKTFVLDNTAGMNYGAYIGFTTGPNAGITRDITSDANITKYFH
jgi:hypothetical protein